AVAGGSIGLLLGGILTETINWHWIFFINLPIGIATALFAVRLVPDREGIGLSAGADIPGAVLLTGGLMLGVYTILGVAEEGWGSSQTLILGAAAIALLAAFVLGALYMQRILGYDALEVGLAYLPMTAVMGAMSFRFTGQLNLRYGPQATLL